jgi:GNAT superfamily N-acetyltransferase
MTIEESNHRIESLWGAYFNSPVDDFSREGTTLLPRERLEAQGVVHVVYIRRRALAEIDPALEAEVRRVLTQAGGRPVLSSELVRRVWGEAHIPEVQAGLIFHLRPGELVRPDLDAGFSLRRLTPDDQAALESLRRRCTAYEIEDAFVELDHEIGWGCFKGGQLTAAGSGHRRNGFMDYGVLTDPEFRGHGLARHVVCGLSDDTLERGLIAQYRCNRVNKASRRVAQAAGFTLYFTTESMKLTG